MKHVWFIVLLGAALGTPRLFAPPPLITGDVPVADRGFFELHTSIRYQDTGRIQRSRSMAASFP